MLPVTEALEALSETLESRHLEYELVAVGGSSLVLLGLITRATRDLDIVAVVEDGQYVQSSPLPQPLVEAVRDVGDVLGIGSDWLKLYAAVDQGPRSKHVEDLRALEPSSDELRGAAGWARTHDPSPGFSRELHAALRMFGVVDVQL